MDAILTAQHATAIVVGHTVRTDGRIGVRFGNKVFVIDTGMQPASSPQARRRARWHNGTFTAIYANRKGSA